MSGKEKYYKVIKKLKKLRNLVKNYAGYPCNASLDYSELYHFLSMPINNVGDPYSKSTLRLNTHDFEKEVIEYIAGLYGKKDQFWGYVTNGGSEGNLCGLHIARNRYPDGIVYFSEHSHYSVKKAAEITRSEAILIPSLKTGEINYEILEENLKNNKNKPAIIMANLGTTMTGAIDDCQKIHQILNRQNITDYYLHYDAALHGMIIPYTESHLKMKLDDIHSLTISGHKFIGSPLPCGIFLTHKSIIDAEQKFVEYININDCTITGSRNAFTPLVLWYGIFRYDGKLLETRAKNCLNLAEKAVKIFKDEEITVWRNEVSPIIVFEKPSEKIIHKWQLATYKDIAHLVIMPHITEKMIKRFVRDIKEYNLVIMRGV